MAKKTKNSNLSLEERLEQALIPNWDEPYKLPPNWCWVKLSTVCYLENGEKSTEKDLVYLDAKTLRGIAEPQTRDSGIIVNKDQKVILVDGENSGEVFVVPYRGYMGSTFKIINISANADEMYIRYFIDQNREILRNSKVGSAIPHLNKDLFFDLKLPFPPLNEQKRIVSYIESLFAKLDEAKEKAQEVVDGFETRKAAILHKAFSGKLTEKWREDNQIGFDTWALFDLQSVCCTSITDGTHKTPIYSDAVNGIPFLSSKDVTSEKINWENIKYIDAKLHEELYARLAPQKDDVLLAKNGTTGVAALVDVDKVFDIYVTLAVLRPNKKIINPKYLYRIVNSPLCKTQFNEHLTGIGVPNLHLRDIKKVIINVPTLLEQEIIVNILDNLISKEQQAKETAESVIEQIEIMKKTILARAFRGELGTNDPSEESAIELLKRVL